MKLSRRGLFGFAAGVAVAPAALASAAGDDHLARVKAAIARSAPNWWRGPDTELVPIAPKEWLVAMGRLPAEWRGNVVVRWTYPKLPEPWSWEDLGEVRVLAQKF